MSKGKETDFVPHMYKIMSEKRVLMTYLGEITPQITNILLRAIKNDNTGFKDQTTVKKKVYKIIVECLENIMRYSDVKEKGEHPSIFLFGKDDDAYYVITGNYVYKTKMPPIKNTLDKINGLTKDEIKKIYAEILAEGKTTEKGGAGLGIIDIALKSENKLQYDFIAVDDNIYFYILKVKVSTD